jgi:hypothetical protein
MSRSTAAALLAAVSLCAVAQPIPPMPARGSFALIGDVPYGAATEPQFDRVIDAINATTRVRFVLHTGDIKAGSERCDDDLLQRRFDQYQRFAKPFVFTPGDNEWTDCHRTNNGSYLPTERLDKVRSLFFPQPGVTTGGQPARVATQASVPGFGVYVENTMWHFGGATMGTIHVVGSNNGYAPWSQIDPTDSYDTPRADRVSEVDARIAAAVAWIDTIFDRATLDRSAGVLVAMQANPNFELPAADRERMGFNAVLERIATRAVAFGKPVVVAHGDSHYYRVDKPLLAPTPTNGPQLLERVTRAENFGSQYVHWLEVEVDARDPEVFRFRPHLIEANLFPR